MAADLLSRLICPADKRLSLAEVKGHGFFAGIRWETIGSEPSPSTVAVDPDADKDEEEGEEQCAAPVKRKPRLGFEGEHLVFVGYTSFAEKLVIARAAVEPDHKQTKDYDFLAFHYESTMQDMHKLSCAYANTQEMLGQASAENAGLRLELDVAKQKLAIERAKVESSIRKLEQLMCEGGLQAVSTSKSDARILKRTRDAFLQMELKYVQECQLRESLQAENKELRLLIVQEDRTCTPKQLDLARTCILRFASLCRHAAVVNGSVQDGADGWLAKDGWRHA